MKSYAFTLQKGGTGKTSISVSVAAELAKNHKVILIDFDPQGNATTWTVTGEMEYEIADYFLDKTPLDNIILKSSLENMDILPTAGLGGRLKDFAESTEQGANPYCISDLLDTLSLYGYEYAVLDLSPSFGLFERNVIIACDEVITPIRPENFAVDGLGIFADNVAKAHKAMRTDRPNYSRIVINAIDRRLTQHAGYLEKVHAELQDFSIYEIPLEPIFPKAQDKNLLIQEMTATKTETLQAITNLANDLENA